jgi:hypothetical protein
VSGGYQKYLDLADAYWVIREQDKAASDSDICRRLGKGGDSDSEFKNYDPDHLRTLLPEARRAVREYFEDTQPDLVREYLEHLEQNRDQDSDL